METNPTPPNIATLPIDEIRPYWRNPRKIPDYAIKALADSITRYGYRQPIVVDSENTVIVGHTRLAALRQLGWTEIPCLVANDLNPDQVREYRLLDNKTGELTDWDDENLTHELRELIDPTLAENYFAYIDLHTHFSKDFDQITDDDTTKATETTKNVAIGGLQDIVVTLTCPHCFNNFDFDPREESRA